MPQPPTPSPRTPGSSSLEQRVDVETPEQVVFSYTVAGIGSRAAAAIVDYLICFAGMLLIMLAILIPVGFASGFAEMGAWSLAVLVIAQFAIVWGYYVLFEGLNDGQTPGKRWMQLRVVQDGGYAVSFSASAVRNLVRFVDLQPAFTYGVGLIAAGVTKNGKRLGDMVAGTMVVRERVVHVAPAIASRATPAGARDYTTLLTDEEFALLERFMARRQSLEADRRRQIADQLAARFRERWTDASAPAQVMLVALFERERAARARGVAARSDTGAAREQHAIVAHGAERWSSFATLLAHARKRGLARMSEDEVSAFVAQYREISTDLARLRTAARGRDIDALFYLSRLVASAHNLFYRQRRLGGATALRYLAISVPREIRRSARPILAAAALLFLPGIITFVTVMRHPETIDDIVPAAMIERAEDGVRRVRNGEGYISDPQVFRPVMATQVIANNVQITFAAFALGITAGIGTALLLVFNSIHIFSVFALYHSKGILPLILAFVAPHGVLELSAICIAGGGGFILGNALLFPGALTRREALVIQGRRAIRLIAGATLLLLVAGTIEGMISPIEYWPLELKGIVSGMTAVLLVAYLSLGRRGEAEAIGEDSAYNAARALISR